MERALLGCVDTRRNHCSNSVRLPDESTRTPLPEAHDAVVVERFVDAHDREAAFESRAWAASMRSNGSR